MMPEPVPHFLWKPGSGVCFWSPLDGADVVQVWREREVNRKPMVLAAVRNRYSQPGGSAMNSTGPAEIVKMSASCKTGPSGLRHPKEKKTP